MAKKPQDKPAPSNPQSTTNGKTEAKPVKFVVVREGHRVSDKEYESSTDPNCVAEITFWRSIANKHSYGERVEAVQYDAKKHRVW